MPPMRSLPTTAIKPVKTERSHEENQERAYIAASRRGDRSLEARIESARRASEIHKRRTGRSLRVTEADVINEEMYEEEDDDLPLQYRRLTAHLNSSSSDFDRQLASYLANHAAMRSALHTAMSSQDGGASGPKHMSPLAQAAAAQQAVWRKQAEQQQQQRQQQQQQQDESDRTSSADPKSPTQTNHRAHPYALSTDARRRSMTQWTPTGFFGQSGSAVESAPASAIEPTEPPSFDDQAKRRASMPLQQPTPDSLSDPNEQNSLHSNHYPFSTALPPDAQTFFKYPGALDGMNGMARYNDAKQNYNQLWQDFTSPWATAYENNTQAQQSTVPAFMNEGMSQTLAPAILDSKTGDNDFADWPITPVSIGGNDNFRPDVMFSPSHVQWDDSALSSGGDGTPTNRMGLTMSRAGSPADHADAGFSDFIDTSTWE